MAMEWPDPEAANKKRKARKSAEDFVVSDSDEDMSKTKGKKKKERMYFSLLGITTQTD
jgi:hypothetical protein